MIAHILRMHPDFESKSAGSITAIAPFKNDYNGHGSRGFHVIHTNGTRSVFSYRVALGMTPPDPQPHQAARAAVADSILAFKKRCFADSDFVACAVSGRLLNYSEVHVDHHPLTFAEIFREFCATYGTPIAVDTEVHCPRGASVGVRFKDEGAISAFREFHDDRAILRLVSAEVNLKENHRGRETKDRG